MQKTSENKIASAQLIETSPIDCSCTNVTLPPKPLRDLVAGQEADVTHYLNLGHAGAQCIIDLLAANGIAINNLDSILDFGCGCGRVLMHLADCIQKPILGTDYNQKLVVWLSNHIYRGKVFLNELAPPTQHANASFDLIYAYSVFTHLTERMQIDWMSEFARIIKPGGYLIVTTHGNHPQLLSKLTDKEKIQFANNDFIVLDGHREGTNPCYSMQTEHHVRGVLCKDFEIIAFEEHGSRGTPPQDIYLMRLGNG